VEDTLPSGATEEDATQRDGMVLVVAFHPNAERIGSIVPIPPGGLRFGRDQPHSQLGSVRDKRMSRAHAEVLDLRGQIVVHDLKSRNGTWVNGQRIAHANLAPGDVLRMGSMAMVLRHEPLPAPVPEGLLGAGPAFMDLCGQIEVFGPREAVVLLEGEPGVGKGVVARALHAASGRTGPFVTFDCGAVAPGVMHSELFGHRAGAFSGAASGRSGLIERARGGTLFLDEVGDASPDLQRSLLRLLEEGEYRPVGSDRAKRADVRVIAATNRDLDTRVEREEFRFDLLTRLRRLRIRVPPLRDRSEDVPLLATRFACARAEKEVTLHRQLAFALIEHPWPGNVRELDAVMERAVVLARGASLLRWSADLLPDGAPVPTFSPRPPRKRRVTPTGFTGQRPSPDELATILKASGGNVTHVSRDLGVARHTLYRWLRDAELDLEDFR
jgi:DNA-binding NtrC family response regulator